MPALTTFLANIDDPRQQGKVRHDLVEMLTVAILACLCGADNCCEIEHWANSRLEWLRRFLPLKSSIASHDTYSHVLASIDAKQFAISFTKWAYHLLPTLQAQGVVAINGKTSRRTKSKDSPPLHLVSAFACEHHLVLGQEAVAHKSNEKTAIPELLDKLALQGCIVTLDAMGADKKIAKVIADKQADYLLAIKDNQKLTKQSIEDFFTIFKQADNQSKTPHSFYQSHDKDRHGVVVRQCYVFEQLDCLYQPNNWHNLQSFAVVINETHTPNNELITQTRFYLSSLKADAKTVLQAVRQHWGIENQLHWCLDVYFNDDLMRTRNKNAAHNLATLKQLALNLIRADNQKPKGSIKSCRLMASGCDDYRERLVGW